MDKLSLATNIRKVIFQIVLSSDKGRKKGNEKIKVKNGKFDILKASSTKCHKSSSFCSLSTRYLCEVHASCAWHSSFSCTTLCFVVNWISRILVGFLRLWSRNQNYIFHSLVFNHVITTFHSCNFVLCIPKMSFFFCGCNYVFHDL